MSKMNKELDQNKLEERAVEVITSNLKSPWSESKLDEIDVYEINGQGYSNKIFRVTHLPSGEKVIVRFYGSALTGKGNKYKPVSNEEEVKVIEKLSQLNLAPKILYAFEDGRIEAFVEGRLITNDEITQPQINEKIAIIVAQIHSMKNMLDRKEPLFNLAIMHNFLEEFEKKKISRENEQDLSVQDLELKRQIMGHDLRKEAEWIEVLFKKIKSRIIFSHNDVHMKNIFVLDSDDANIGDERKSESELLLMDYEYSCYNYRWADLANHLCEISLHTFDLESGECKIGPMNRDERLAFIRVYLEKWLELKEGKVEKEEKENKKEEEEDEEDEDVDSLDSVMMQVDFGLLVVHLMRVLFFTAYIGTNYGPLQSWPYTKVRLERYLTCKEEFISHYSRLL